MRTSIIGLSVILVATPLAGAALAGPGAPSTPPPATGFVTPLTGNRDDSPDWPAAIQAPDPCTSESREGSAMTTTTMRSVAPTMVNGAMVPAPLIGPRAAAWCGGAYDPQAGTNFSDR
jgi:hypothetical protein